MTRAKYSCDFETTTKLDDCRVWAYGWMELFNRKNYKIGNSLVEFMSWVEHIKADLFFHNLSFDGEFIVNHLLHLGWECNDSGKPNTFNTVISNMGQWYIIDICYGYIGTEKQHTVIYDSKKKLPFSVKQIAIDFKMFLKKGDIDYHLERPVGWEITDDEHDYIKNDIEIVAEALEIQYNQGLDRITSGSDSMKGFKSIISTKMFNKLFPTFSLELDKELRNAYRGGFTWLNERFANSTVGEGIVLDVNSQYPAQMYDKPLPFGFPIEYDGKYEHDEDYPLYIQHIKCEFMIKDDRIPTIQIKKNLAFKENEYLKDSKGERVDLYLTNIDLELVLEHYELYDEEYIKGWKFKQKTGIFNGFIEKWMYIKSNNEGAVRILAKLMLNSLYGKFASNPKVTGKYPYLKKETGATGYSLPKDDEGNVIDEYKKPIYTPMGIFITSWARYNTITTAQKCFDRVIYCDTDSMHLVGLEIPEVLKDVIDSDKLGFWDWEGSFKRGKYIRQKTYCYEMYAKEVVKNGKTVLKSCTKDEATTVKFSVKCAGMGDRAKEKVTFDNFKIGLTVDGNLMPKHVNGGIVLVPDPFTIKGEKIRK